MSLCDYVSVCICLYEYVCLCISVYVRAHKFGRNIASIYADFKSLLSQCVSLSLPSVSWGEFIFRLSLVAEFHESSEKEFAPRKGCCF